MTNKEEYDNYYGKGGRLTNSAARELVESAYDYECKEQKILFHDIGLADIAHVLMLMEEAVIPPKEGTKLLKGLLDLQRENINDIPIRNELGDIYNVRTGLLEEKIGKVTGWMHAGRPRREAITTGYLLNLRNRLLRLIKSHLRLISELLTKAKNHKSTLMPDFTYLHHAQPTSFAHYLLTFVYPALRDIERLKTNFERINSSPCGSGSVNGSRLPLNRTRLMDLLGFDRMSKHTRDAMWQPDIPIETASNLLAILINISRFSEELQIWSTSEFDLIDIPDSFCRASVIMPQKKNPYALTYIRGLTGDMIGVITSIAGVAKTSSGNPDSRMFVYGKLPRSVEQVEKALELFASVIKEMKPNTEIMLQKSTEGFSQATDLADLIMQERNIEYRSAHQIVGKIVKNSIQNGHKRFILTSEMIDEVTDEIIQTKINLDQKQIDSILNPLSIVESRQSSGSASKSCVQEMINECQEFLHEMSEWRDGCEERSLKALEDIILIAEEKIRVDK